MKQTKILFVCLGNICRSQMAQAIFQEKVNQAGLEKWIQIDSAGTSPWNQGKPIDQRAAAKLREHAVQTDHRARQITKEDFNQFDLILAMDNDNYETLLQLFGEDGKIRMFRSFDPEGNGEVPDPYYGGEAGFDLVFAICDRTCEALLQSLRSQFSAT